MEDIIKESSKLDDFVINRLKIPSLLLMEEAASGVVDEIKTRFSIKTKICFFIGPGNNGGDALSVLRKLICQGYKKVTCIIVGRIKSEDAKRQYDFLKYFLEETLEFKKTQVKKHLESCELIVDGIFGSGLSKDIEGDYKAAIEIINQYKKLNNIVVLFIDVPSGLCSKTGRILGGAVSSSITVTLGTYKLGLLLYPGKEFCGELVLRKISFPEKAIKKFSLCKMLSRHSLRHSLKRPSSKHKGFFGHTLIIGGSLEMPGAALLSSLSALRAGCGSVTLAMPKDAYESIQIVPDIMRSPLPLESKSLAHSSKIDLFLESLKKFDSIVVGPGFGKENNIALFFETLMTYLLKESINVPVVLDADALYFLSKKPKKLSRNFLLTPHLGEASKLISRSVSSIQKDLLEAALELKKTFLCNIVLKSATSILALKESCELWINSLSSSALSKAGSGDVLSGILAGTLAQRELFDLEKAIVQGVLLHSYSGVIASSKSHEASLNASDIIDSIGEAYSSFDNIDSRT